MQWTGWNAMPEHRTLKAYDCPILSKKLKKRKIPITNTRKQIQLNIATLEFEHLNRNKNDSIKIFFQGLAPTESTDNSTNGIH
jgi:hypothetical protein